MSDFGTTKLVKDWGVSATIGSLIITGSFAVIIIGMLRGIDITGLLPLIGGWIGGIVGSIFTIKAVKQSKEDK